MEVRTSQFTIEEHDARAALIDHVHMQITNSYVSKSGSGRHRQRVCGETFEPIDSQEYIKRADEIDWRYPTR